MWTEVRVISRDSHFRTIIIGSLLAPTTDRAVYLQALTAIKALIAHSIRTGASLDEFFGNWRPPDKT